MTPKTITFFGTEYTLEELQALDHPSGLHVQYDFARYHHQQLYLSSDGRTASASVKALEKKTLSTFKHLAKVMGYEVQG